MRPLCCLSGYHGNMALLQLPSTHGCLVCGRFNPQGLRLDLHVDETSGVVHTTFVPTPHHIGFENVLHGGLMATVVDEAMVWAATWVGRRFCLCGELTVRFREPGRVGDVLSIQAGVDVNRSKLITTSARVVNSAGTLVATASGKYVPVSPDEHQRVVQTFTPSPLSARATQLLQGS